jgi:hypothetical protein
LRVLCFAKRTHLLRALPGDPGDVDVQAAGGGTLSLGAAGGLETLELVEGL